MARAAANPASSDRCPRCGGSVGCGIATGACWCAELTLSAERQQELAARYDGCLCPACLRELEQARADIRADRVPGEADQTLMPSQQFDAFVDALDQSGAAPRLQRAARELRVYRRA